MALSPFAAHAAPAVLEQVIVEAQKKVENVQDTPIAIQAMTGEQFQQTASFNLAELARSTPGLAFDTGVQTDIRLRGTSTVAGAPVSLRTNIYVDGALIEQPRAVFAAQYDISRFEILKGPQGTLYGKSSPTGTINIRTQNPNLSEVDGYVAGSVGERDLHNTQFGVSLPIIEDELAIRLAGVYDESKTGVKSEASGKEAANRGKAGRLTVLWQPNDDFMGRLSYTYTEASSNPLYSLNGQGYRYYDDKANTNFEDADFTRDQLAILELSYNINDHMSLTSVTAYEDQYYTNDQDMDGSDSDALYLAPRPAPPGGPGGVYNGLLGGDKQRVNIKIPTNIQQDLRLASEDNDFLDWQVGGYYKYNKTNTPINVKKFSASNQSSVSIESAYVGLTEEWAAYTHNTFKFTDEFNLIVGLRAVRQRANSLQPTNGCLINGAAPADCTDNDINLVEIGALRGDGIPLDDQMSYSQPITGTVKAQYFFNVDLAGYISIDRAYRTGAANLNLQGNIPDDFIILGSESSKSVEVGLKGSFWDQRARFSLAVFDQIYSGFQQDIQNVTVADPLLGESNANSFVVNAKEAEIRGLEAELTVLALDSWQLSASTTYNDAKFNDFKDNPCTGAPGTLDIAGPGPQYNTCDLSGEALPLAPKWSGVVTSNFSMPAPGLEGIDWYFNALLNTRSSQVDKVTRRTLGGYTTVDLFTGLRTLESRGWDINLWLKNAFDRRAVTRIFNSTASNPDLAGQSPTAFDMVTTNPPRQLGVTGTYRF